MQTIEPKELQARLESGEALTLVDVREEDERLQANIGGLFIPLGQIVERSHEIPRNQPIVVYCRSGGRSARAIEVLQSAGFNNLINLAGGILRWQEQGLRLL